MKELNHCRFVWYDAESRGRNLHACFRQSFDLARSVKQARIHLFADTTYQLFMNGQLVEFGPVRFDPRFPMYDTIDLRPYLRRGRNVIAVSVNSFQHKTYKSIPNPAGFIAGGEIIPASGKTISLDTPGDWRCIRDRAQDRYAAKFSFALNAAEIFDQSGEEPDWREIDFDDRHWPHAVLVDDQSSWGPLEPRSIPFLDKSEIPLAEVKHLLPLDKTEDWYSFSAPYPPYYEDNGPEFSNFFAFCTWIYSPVQQEIIAGVFWGENWLNGEPIPEGVDGVTHNQRIQQRWSLRKGWNFLFGKVGAYHDIVEQYFALPSGLGLLVAADKKPNSIQRFKRSRLLTKKEYDKFISPRKLPFAPNEKLAEIGGWIVVEAAQSAQSASREMGWDSFGEARENLDVQSLAEHVFKLADYPHGFSLLLDIGYTRLFLPCLRAKGVAGATIDFGYAEHLHKDGMHFYIQHHFPCADRILCSRDEICWRPIHPKGGRYLMITVRNPQSDVTFHSFSLRSAMYPVKKLGSFKCSDPLLTTIWEMGERSQATNMEDAYDDCVGRERGMYIRDTIIQYHINLVTFGDHALMQRCVQLYGQSPNETGKFRAVYPNTGYYTIADFSLNMVEGYWNYYQFSGDLERARKDWDIIQRNLQWFHDLSDERKDLLLDADWPQKRKSKEIYGGFHGDLSAKDRGYMSEKGVHCSLSCFYLMAIQAAIHLAKALGHTQERSQLKKRATLLTASIRKAFWDPTKGCFADNLQRETHSAHSSLLAASAGVATRQQIPLMRRHIAKEFKLIFRNGFDPRNGSFLSPFYSFYIFDGLYRIGLYETAEGIMRQGWGWMLAQGLKTCSEYFELGTSHCHAASASPTYYLSTNVLGVQFPQAPNLDVVRIAVRTHDVTWAEGTVPHPKGLIRIKWHMTDRGRVFDYIRAPKGVEVEVDDTLWFHKY